MPTAVVIPTFNERDNIEFLINEILLLPIDVRVIIVDDNSPDGTGLLVDSISQQNAAVSCLHRPAKLGLGTAHIAGMRHAFVLNCDPIISMDADFSHNPRYIPGMLAGLEDHDVIIGSRYAVGGGMQGRSALLRFVSWGANMFSRIILGVVATDCTSGFRAYRRVVLESIDLDHIFSNGYSFLIEMLFLCQSNGWRIGEVPILYEDRRAGTTKISRNEIFKALYTVLRLTWRRTRTFKNVLLGR